jgi:hypothetical protein
MTRTPRTAAIEMATRVERIPKCTQRHTPGNPVPFADSRHRPDELTHLSRVAVKCLTLLATSASMERALSVAKYGATDFQMGCFPEVVYNECCSKRTRGLWRQDGHDPGDGTSSVGGDGGCPPQSENPRDEPTGEDAAIERFLGIDNYEN